MDVEPAGDDADLVEARRRRSISDRADRAEELLREADVLLKAGDRGRAEELAREALQRFSDALDWAEDAPEEAATHKRLDTAGNAVRRVFGCQIGWDGSSYFQACPVALAHVRVGLSVGGIARKVCSLCAADLSECPHRRGTAYWVHGGVGPLEWCRVCMSHTGCEHRPDERYRASVGAVVVEIRLEEVSIVDKPAFPSARITRRPVSTSDLEAALGAAVPPGTPISCDRCLSACDGLQRPWRDRHGRQ